MLAALLFLAGCAAPTGAVVVEERNAVTSIRTPDEPRPRDGDVAIRQELDAARRTGTIAAYDLFIARHPGHALADIARRERTGLPSARD